MLGELAKRLTNAVVLFLAAITFFLVPLGDRTPLQHLTAILDTPAARRAADACADAGRLIAGSVVALREPPKQEAPPPSELMPAD